MTYESFTLHEMSPACGAIIEDIDLSQDLTNRQFDEIHEVPPPHDRAEPFATDVASRSDGRYARQAGEPDGRDNANRPVVLAPVGALQLLHSRRVRAIHRTSVSAMPLRGTLRTHATLAEFSTRAPVPIQYMGRPVLLRRGTGPAFRPPRAAETTVS